MEFNRKLRNGSVLQLCFVSVVLAVKVMSEPVIDESSTDALSNFAGMMANSTGFDLGQLFSYIGAQLFHATVNDTFPTNPLISLSPSFARFKLDVFPKSDIQTRMYYGNASNGLPDRVQGIWLAEGLGLPSDAISSAGVYDPIMRKLTISPLYTRAWAYQATSSVRNGLLWTPSGAAIFNSNLAFGFYFDIFFNEDITFGQIMTGFKILGFPILLPVFAVNFTMEWLGNDSWRRTSSIFSIPVAAGDYFLKRAVNGDGSKGPYYNEFLAYANGGPIAVPVPV